MKKILLVSLCLCMLLPIKVKTLTLDVGSAYLINADSGEVIYALNEEAKMYPASMTKMMTLLLVFEAIANQQLKWDDLVVATKEACAMGGTQIYLQENESMSVEDLVYSVCLASANDASVALGVHLKGTHQRFVDAMNDKAKTLKLVNTHFMNANGLHHDNHYSCAKDMAMIAKELLKVGGQKLLSITSTYEYYIREDKEPFWLVNTNKLLKTYPGVNGLKTGFTSQALSCICISAKQNNKNLIGVIMKAKDSKVRNKAMIEMLDYGFIMLKEQCLYDTGKYKYQLKLKHSNLDEVTLANKQAIVTSSINKHKIIKEEVKILKKLPFEKEEVVAKLIITLDNKQQIQSDLMVLQACFKEELVTTLIKQLKSLLF